MRVFKIAYLSLYSVSLISFFLLAPVFLSSSQIVFAEDELIPGDIDCPPDPPPSDCDYNDPGCDSSSLTCAKFDRTYRDQMPGGFKFPVSGDEGNADYGFKGIVNKIVTNGGAIIGGIAVLKIMFGGILYATAAGNPKVIGQAKSHIMYALIGIALLVGMNVVLFLIGAL